MAAVRRSVDSLRCVCRSRKFSILDHRRRKASIQWLGKEPSVPDNEIVRLQLFVRHARPVFCRVVQVSPPAEPGEGEPANPFAEAGFDPFVGFRICPRLDQVPNQTLIFHGDP